jgi:glycine/D-amino acid oxidase-like deaminating enzyme
MTLSADVLIVGAGIVGAACAFELAKAGWTTPKLSFL